MGRRLKSGRRLMSKAQAAGRRAIDGRASDPCTTGESPAPSRSQAAGSCAVVRLRRFDSEEQREALYAAVYQSAEWQNVIAPQIPAMMDRERMVVRRIAPTEKSVLR